jgi:DNA replication protein DnaC
METSNCIHCGTLLEFEPCHDMGLSKLRPTLCDTCYAKIPPEPSERREVESWTDHLPYKTWDEAKGNRAVLNKIGQAAFKNRLPRTGVLYVVGGVAAGKTVSVCALARTARERGWTGRYTSCPDLLEGYSMSLKGDSDDTDYAARFANEKGILIIDDLGVGRLTERGIELLYRIFNKRMENQHAVTWVTSNWTIDKVGEWIMKAGKEELTAQRIARRIAERAVVVQL